MIQRSGSPMNNGRVPLRLLFARERARRLVKLLKDDGMVPERRFSDKSRVTRRESLPREAGSEPLKLLFVSHSCGRAVRLPRLDGITPLNWLL